MPDVSEIVAEYLTENGFGSLMIREIIEYYLQDNDLDGLAGDGCGCGVLDLGPCNKPCADCVPAIYKPCRGCTGEEQAECEFSDNDSGGCYVPKEAPHVYREIKRRAEYLGIDEIPKNFLDNLTSEQAEEIRRKMLRSIPGDFHEGLEGIPKSLLPGSPVCKEFPHA